MGFLTNFVVAGSVSSRSRSQIQLSMNMMMAGVENNLSIRFMEVKGSNLMGFPMRTKGMESSSDGFNKDSIEHDERRLTELGRRTIGIFVLVHIFSVGRKHILELACPQDCIHLGYGTKFPTSWPVLLNLFIHCFKM